MNAADYIQETTRAQRRAADPAVSTFVSANAGAGKTRVLTNRVARLLLADANPSTILCITFTKAAAAEMSDRLFALLGEWALASDAGLQKALGDLDGDLRPRSAAELARGRRLFARALETPGGLKIQTIHSFSESILRRFPLEAGIAPGFTVIEEIEAAKLLSACIDCVAADPDPAIDRAFARLLAQRTGTTLRDLLESCVGQRRKFARAISGGWGEAGDEIAAALGATGDESVDRLVDRIAAFDLDRLEALLLAGTSTTITAAAAIQKFRVAASAEEKFNAITPVFLTTEMRPRKKVLAASAAHSAPEFVVRIEELQAEIAADLDRIRAGAAVADTRALYVILEHCFDEFRRAKSARAALDFDDLIETAGALLTADRGAAWVLYKLDKGLQHILLDEAQDTGPDAWRVIEAPLREFFSGAGAAEKNRTFFAVGDQKQSIYSFQGADAALFNEKETEIGKRISAAGAYHFQPLLASFRTTAPILNFVDALFRPDEVIDNVSVERPLRHYCTREGHAGLVELWPLTPRAASETPDPWDAPLDAALPDSPAKNLAAEISGLIASWLKDGEPLASQDRPIEAGDIMILVQSRGKRSRNALFTEMIRALSIANVPVAGADKMKLIEDQGVLDLVSFARAVLFDGDDLSLAETLKSPFFGLDDETLYDLAADRIGSLSAALEARRGEREEWDRAAAGIAQAREIALSEGAAAFFTHCLETGSPSGWRRVAGRLGRPTREPIEEFLRQAHEFEMRHPRSLRLFLDAMQKSGAEISREATEAGTSVRVMTAHKAKGLEADVVFLLDAHRLPLTGKGGDLVALEIAGGDEAPVLAVGDARANTALSSAQERMKRLKRDEYRRLLYVAATRARDRLYICGLADGRRTDPHKAPLAEKSWHALAEDAFDRLNDRVEDAGDRFGGRARRIRSGQLVPPSPSRAPRAAPNLPCTEKILERPAPAESRQRRVSPSQLVDHDEQGPSAYSPIENESRFLRGRVLHRLLELLPAVEQRRQRGVADRLLAAYSQDFSQAERKAMREETMRVIEDSQFAEVFGPASLAEAAIGGRLKRERGDLLLSGQIDRLAVFSDRVLVVDFKTNRPPPRRVEDVPRAYLVQMAAYRALLQEVYPGRKIFSALLWTYDARLMPLSDAVLDSAQLLTLA